MFKVKTIPDLELLYSVLREEYPNRQIKITYNYNTKEYTVIVTNDTFVSDPEIPLDVNIEVVYGDSVTGDTPLLLRDPITKQVTICSIESIGGEWQAYPEFKLFDRAIRLEKEYSTSNFDVWCDQGWTPIKKVIRHKTNKRIVNVWTHTGCVDVTEDYSLCTPELNKVEPKSILPGDHLLHNFPHDFLSIPESELHSESQAFVYGFNLGSEHLTKAVPDYILNSSVQFIRSFLQGYWSTSFGKCEHETDAGISFHIKGQLAAQGMFYLLRKLGYTVSIQQTGNTVANTLDKTHIYKLTLSLQPSTTPESMVKKITPLQTLPPPTFTQVYDLETECGRFNAGVGQMIVFNTDSIMVRFKYNLDDFNQNRIDTFRLATICGEKLTGEIFARPPIEMEFEKVFQPFVLLTKKRYIANKYENMKDPFHLKGLDAKGIALTRRDYCRMVKACYKEVIDAIMDTSKANGIKRSIRIFKAYIDRIDNYDIDIEDLVVSAMLAKSYKTKPVHVLLAEKLKERKEQVQIGDSNPLHLY
jgi:hypothetical protein